jgi:signal transduction histidine kinase
VQDPKDRIAASIASAQAHLEQAMMDLAAESSLSYNAVAFAAHALNNYLAVVSGVSDLVGNALTDYPDPRIHTWLTGIQRSTRMMAQIVASLMKDALISGRPNITLEKTNFGAVISTICDYYQVAAQRKQIQLVWQPPDDPDCYVWTDGTAIAAVMDNLLSNAIKYSPGGTTIVVTIRGELHTYVCAVRDEGPGISAEDQQLLFQRGVRLSAVPTGGESSHGYGLAVAKELLTLVGGEIWCESTLGEGATFLFRLPAFPRAETDTR